MKKKEGVRDRKRSSVWIPALRKIKGAVMKVGGAKTNLKKEGTGVGARTDAGALLVSDHRQLDVFKKCRGSEEMLLEGWRTPDLQPHRIIKLS